MKKLFSLLVISLVMSGCSLTPKAEQSAGGGVFKTTNIGATWQSASTIATASGVPQSFVSLDVISLAVDPSDQQALYFGSLRDGLFYSYNQANTWTWAQDLSTRSIGGIAVDPKDKCTIYVTSNNQIFKSTDCSRSWEEMYIDNEQSVLFTSVVVDHYDSKNIYITNSRGDVMKSADSGKSWLTLHNFKVGVSKLIMSPHDSRLLMAATNRGGLFRSRDAGRTWTDFTALNKENYGNKKVRDIVPSTTEAGFWLMATEYGLYQTVNDGDNWTEIKLLLPERKSTINGVALSHTVTSKMYYVTDYNFYYSVDGGVNWVSRSLPTSRRGWRLLVDQKDDNVVYLGVSTRP